MTAANSLNISEAGYCVFDGVNVFRGRTFQQGAGITITNADGVAGDTTISASGSTTASFITVEIDLKVVGITPLFTTSATLNFWPINVIFICDSATSVTGDGTYSIGWAASYDQLISPNSFIPQVSGQFSTNTVNSPAEVIPPLTTIAVNVSVGDSATVFTGRVAIVGFYA